VCFACLVDSTLSSFSIELGSVDIHLLPRHQLSAALRACGDAELSPKQAALNHVMQYVLLNTDPVGSTGHGIKAPVADVLDLKKREERASSILAIWLSGGGAPLFFGAEVSQPCALLVHALRYLPYAVQWDHLNDGMDDEPRVVDHEPCEVKEHRALTAWSSLLRWYQHYELEIEVRACLPERACMQPACL
jgi:hypothetical protein